MLDSKMIFPIVGKGLVEGCILLCGDVGWISSPDGLDLVELLLCSGLLLHLLSLFLFLFLVFVNFLDLGFLVVTLLNLLFIFIRNFLLDFLSNVEENRVRDELAIVPQLGSVT